MKRTFLIVLLALPAFAQSTPPPANPKPGKIFDELADSALRSCRASAPTAELKEHL
jgi:hypothetical protein